MSEVKNRCGNCMEPYNAHRQRMSAPPICRNHKVYREATEEELHAAYTAKFGDGPPEPITTFRHDNPQDMERLKNVLGADALSGFFRPGGGGMDAFDAALREAGRG